MRTFVILCILALLGLTLQQSFTPSCGKFAIQNQHGQITKYRMKPKFQRRRLQHVVTAPAFCAYKVHRRLQSVQELSCRHNRRLQHVSVPTFCPVVNGWQCRTNSRKVSCP